MDQQRQRVSSTLAARDVMARKLENNAARKNNKPLMEKRRRARINSCLNQLKHLVLESTKKNAHAKLEKADILEITVGYLQKQRKREREMQGPANVAALCQFIEGYSVCMADAVAFLDSSYPSSEASIARHLLDHLQSQLQSWRMGRSPPQTSSQSSPHHLCTQPPLKIFIPRQTSSPVRPLPIVPCSISQMPLTPLTFPLLTLDTPENSPPQENGVRDQGLENTQNDIPWRPW